MAKRRLSGDGMVRKRADGYWEGNIVVGHKNDGKPIFRSVFAKTQKELLVKLQDLKEEYKGVELTEDSTVTLETWLRRWLDGTMSIRLRQSTLNKYRSMIENNLIPFLGSRQITRITAADIQKLYNRLRTEGGAKSKGKPLSDTTVHDLHMLFHEALDGAVSEHLIANNPTVNVTPPKISRKPLQVLNDKQLAKFLKITDKDPAWGDFFRTELTTGLRRGEICGLKWEDFDGEKGSLKVQRSVTVGDKGGLVIGETKTENGVRTIKLPESTAELLRNRKKKVQSKWIFPNFFNAKEPLNPESAYDCLKRILRENNLPDLRFHDLRHTFATHATASGVDAKTLSGILGHAKASFTLDVYTHVTPEMLEHASGVVEDFMTDILGKELTPWEKS